MAIGPRPPQPPTPDVPYWRDGEGRRVTLGMVIAGRDRGGRERAVEQHAEAVSRIVHAAGAAVLEGRDGPARTLAAHASKLCGELVGLWPSGSDAPL